MNLRYTDQLPQDCARNLDDKILEDQIRDTVCFLTTAVNRLSEKDVPTESVYVTYNNIVTWITGSRSSFSWSLSYFEHLLNEHEYRFNEKHRLYKYFDQFAYFYFDATSLDLFEEVASKEPPNCTPYKKAATIHAYRYYLVNDVWSDNSTWTKSDRPYWFEEYLEVNWDTSQEACL